MSRYAYSYTRGQTLVPHTFKLRPDTLSKLKDHAATHGTPMQDLIEAILRAYLSPEQGQDPTAWERAWKAGYKAAHMDMSAYMRTKTAGQNT